MVEKKKHTLLVGNGKHQHTLYGKFRIDEDAAEYPSVEIIEESILKHENPNGSFSNEHHGLQIEAGNWSVGTQVEFNPFDKEITRIWD